MRKAVLFFLLFFLFSCSQKNELVVNRNNRGGSKSEENRTDQTTDTGEVAPLELSTLFYSKSYFVKKVTRPVKPKEKPVIKPVIDAAVYKVIADWMVAGKRHIKLKNTRTGKEYLVKEGAETGDVILLERGLFTYRFKINGIEIEVNR